MNLRAHAFGALLLLSSAAFATEDKITLRWNVRPEERFEHQIRFVIDAGENGTVSATMHFAERVLSVTDKSIKSSMYVPGVSVTSSGALAAAAPTFEDMKGLKYERECDLTGKALSVAGMSGLGGSTVDLLLPTTEVGVGDKWESSFNPNPAIGDVKVTYVLEGFDKDTATVRADLAESDKLSVVKPYQFVVERSSGRYRSAEGALKMNLSGVSLSVSFSHRTILPVKLRSNGA
jgi:hypothetical protein